MKKIALSLLLVVAVMFSCSCGNKNPLEGTWKADSYGELEITDVKISIDEDTFKMEGIKEEGEYVEMIFEYDMDDSKIYFTDFVDAMEGNESLSRDYPEEFEEMKSSFSGENMSVSYKILRKTLILGGGEEDEFFPDKLKLTK